MKPEKFLSAIAKVVQKSPHVVVVVVLLLTVISGVVLRDIEFETDATAFFPENELVEANRRMEGYFGRDAYMHLIQITSVEPNSVLSPVALREQYNMSLAVKGVEGVVGTQSVADIVNEMCHYLINPMTGNYRYNESRNLLNTPVPEIQGRINTLRSLMDGEVDPSQFSQGSIVLDPGAIRFAFGLLVSSDFNLSAFTASRSLMIVELDGNFTRADLRGVVGDVKNAVFVLPLEYTTETQASEYYIAYEMETTIRPTMALLGIAIVSIITLILVWSFRHFSYVWAPMLTLLVAIVWTFATMTALGFVFSFLEVAVIPLIVGLGVDYSVHISKRYQEGLAKGKSIEESMSTSIVKVGGALFLAFITTVVAFLSNFVSDIGPIRAFGLICAVGITYAYLLAILFYPSIRLIVDRKRGGLAAAPKSSPRMDRAMRKTATIVEEYPRPILVIALVLVIGSLFASTMVPVEFNLEAFLPSEWESIQTSESIRENFDVGAFSTVYVLVEAKQEDTIAKPNVLDGLFNITERMEDDTFVVKVEDSKTGNYTYFIESIADMVWKAVSDDPAIAPIYNLHLESGRPIIGVCSPEDVGALFNYLSVNDTIYDGLGNMTYAEKFPTMVYYNEATGLYSATVVRQQVTSRSDADNRVIVSDSQGAVEGFPEGKVSITGGVILTQTMLDTLSESQISSTIISMLFALGVLILVYRSIVLGAVSILPVVVAMCLSMGSMWVLGISLNALTIMITALTIGLGVDYAVHFVERFKEEEAGHNPSLALHRTLENTGSALMISAMTTMFGFGVLAIAGIPIFTDFGILTAVMIAYSLLAAVIVTPVPLMWLARRKYRKRFIESNGVSLDKGEKQVVDMGDLETRRSAEHLDGENTPKSFEGGISVQNVMREESDEWVEES